MHSPCEFVKREVRCSDSLPVYEIRADIWITSILRWMNQPDMPMTESGGSERGWRFSLEVRKLLSLLRSSFASRRSRKTWQTLTLTVQRF